MAKPNDFDFYCERVLFGKTKVKKVYESERILAFYHTKPKYNTHIVVVPKEHVLSIMQASEQVVLEIFNVAQGILKRIDYDSDGGRLITNLGKFQDTPHLHFHIVSDGKYPNIKLN